MISLSVTAPDLARINSRLQLLGATLQAVAGRGFLIGPNVDYGGFVTSGTRSHAIYPRSARALYWEGAAHPVAMVNHPGTKPNDYLSQGLMEAAPAATNAILNGITDLIAGSGSGSLESNMRDAAEIIRQNVTRAAPLRSGNLRQSIHTEAR